MDDELVANMFKSFGAPLAQKFPALWPEELSFERFQWAYTVVSSRAFTISGATEPTLLPVIDMANHDHTSPAARIIMNGDGSFQVCKLVEIILGFIILILFLNGKYWAALMNILDAYF